LGERENGRRQAKREIEDNRARRELSVQRPKKKKKKKKKRPWGGGRGGLSAHPTRLSSTPMAGSFGWGAGGVGGKGSAERLVARKADLKNRGHTTKSGEERERRKVGGASPGPAATETTNHTKTHPFGRKFFAGS